ncbi:hypothetical protein [Parenemella sanctibonifatiensis]|uniref:PH domain-containing protein n=1 Tax=Parenemella sanctibonifatiensis TaxID=2016505 RepID=A0A255EI39_9ACTN|nr:hypothetical protein [Parenemella sanctibonifatiensis]OYN91186.1 hypothetical protein CGZ91_06945 [Parenemella sanctibonifatiensis]
MDKAESGAPGSTDPHDHCDPRQSNDQVFRVRPLAIQVVLTMLVLGVVGIAFLIVIAVNAGQMRWSGWLLMIVPAFLVLIGVVGLIRLPRTLTVNANQVQWRFVIGGSDTLKYADLSAIGVAEADGRRSLIAESRTGKRLVTWRAATWLPRFRAHRIIEVETGRSGLLDVDNDTIAAAIKRHTRAIWKGQ